MKKVIRLLWEVINQVLKKSETPKKKKKVTGISHMGKTCMKGYLEDLYMEVPGVTTLKVIRLHTSKFDIQL